MTDSKGDVVDFAQAKKQVEETRKEQRAKDMEGQFKKAMGWKSKAKIRKKPSNKGPKPRRP
ncbi:hypothetical protein A9Q99_18725 [Gammaproteobacteria bacterium 45_16_T64]|nr:hypothetical protein A9Q99_18725 [Gammaproteobacteria bacterium 45_16_T64]